MVEAAHRLAAHNAGEVSLCVDGASLDAALDGGEIALVLALEGAAGIGSDVELFETFHRLGVRIVSLAHHGRNALADGSGEDATGSRLTRAGTEAVMLLQSLGDLIDISHLSARCVDHVLELASRPVVATHSCARALHDHHRNLCDDHLRGVAATGGIVCVSFFGPHVGSEPTLDRLVDHIEYIAELVGTQHVGIGPDFVEQIERELFPPWSSTASDDTGRAVTAISGLEGPSGLPTLTARLQDRGLSDAAIRGVLGENLLGLFRRELGQPSGQASTDRS
jgi:membrane dipeptidase